MILPSTDYICSACRRHISFLRRADAIRRYVTHVSNAPYSEPTHFFNKAYVRLRSRRLIFLHGQDASKYLQGLVTANVTPLSQSPGHGFYSAFLNAQGRVLHDVFIRSTPKLPSWWEANATTEQDGGYLIEADASEITALYKHLKRYKLRA